MIFIDAKSDEHKLDYEEKTKLEKNSLWILSLGNTTF